MWNRSVHLRFAILAAIVLGILPVGSHGAADTAATMDAKRVLRYIDELPNRTENRVISGQFLGYAFQVSSGNYDKEIKTLHDSTGKWAAIVATDFAFSHGPYQVYCSLLVNYWKAGHLVALSHHIPKPAKAISALPTDSAWKAQLDSIAVRLKYLSDRGVVVLWRPFHEMNGTWFWYGSQSRTNDEFKALWRHMFTYFTKTKGLHNLLWVYSPDDGPGKVLDDYPGDAYVDIVSLDRYNGYSSTLTINNYTQITSLGKPFGLGEFSPKGASSTDARFETRVSWKVLTETGLKTKYPKTSFFLAWDRQWGMAFNLDAKSVLNDPWVVTREELDWKSQSVSVSSEREASRGQAPTALIHRGILRTGDSRSWEGDLVDARGGTTRIRVQAGRSNVPRGLPAGLLLLVEDGRQGVPVLVVP